MTVVEVLKAARARIERGWVQGPMAVEMNPDRRCCLMTSTMWLSVAQEVENAADMFIAKAIGVSPNDVARWNDAPHRIKADALAVVDKAIALAETAS